MKNTSYLRDKGVKPDDLDYVLFKVSKQVDDKTDFKKAADAFLKENPRFTGFQSSPFCDIPVFYAPSGMKKAPFFRMHHSLITKIQLPGIPQLCRTCGYIA